MSWPAKSLAEHLAQLGVTPGDVVMVHSSLSSMGFVLGGAATCVAALIDTVGEAGTVVMPGFSPEVSDPAAWTPTPGERFDVEEARRHVPSFDKATRHESLDRIAMVGDAACSLISARTLVDRAEGFLGAALPQPVG